jgi:hypothetical protein
MPSSKNFCRVQEMRREKRLSENEDRYLKREERKRAKRKRNDNSSPGLCVCPAIKGDDSSVAEARRAMKV